MLCMHMNDNTPDTCIAKTARVRSRPHVHIFSESFVKLNPVISPSCAFVERSMSRLTICIKSTSPFSYPTATYLHTSFKSQIFTTCNTHFTTTYHIYIPHCFYMSMFHPGISCSYRIWICYVHKRSLKDKSVTLCSQSQKTYRWVRQGAAGA